MTCVQPFKRGSTGVAPGESDSVLCCEPSPDRLNKAGKKKYTYLVHKSVPVLKPETTQNPFFWCRFNPTEATGNPSDKGSL